MRIAKQPGGCQRLDEVFHRPVTEPGAERVDPQQRTLSGTGGSLQRFQDTRLSAVVPSRGCVPILKAEY